MFTGTEDLKLDVEDAAALTKNYRDMLIEEEVEDECLGTYFSSAGIQSLLDQRDCVGIRVYFALNDDGSKNLVIVGVSADENDQLGDDDACLGGSLMCPPRSGRDTILNS